jgi:Oxidoreductase family, NAD-binding Rossmann fold
MSQSDGKSDVRIGLIGCGRVAEFGYLPAFRQARGVVLVGIADVNPSRCRALAPVVPAYGNVQSLIQAGGLDAIVIAVPTCHWRIAKFRTISSAFERCARPSDSSRYCESIGEKIGTMPNPITSRQYNTWMRRFLFWHSSARNFSGRGWCLIESATMPLPPMT